MVQQVTDDVVSEKERPLSEYTREEILELIRKNGGPKGLDLSGKDLSGIDLGWEAIEAELEKALKSAPGEIPVWYSELTGGINLEGAILIKASLNAANLIAAYLNRANLNGAYLDGADLNGANLNGVGFNRANLHGADLSMADLFGAYLSRADLSRAYLIKANLSMAILDGANLGGAILHGAYLNGAYLGGADLSRADLSRVSLSGAYLVRAILVETNLTGADLTGCSIYGISAWELKLEGATQIDLIITRDGEPTITVDNLEVAQFIYLLLNNEKIRDVIDTITSKVVLILGRFTPERKVVLDAIRDELRKRDYLPVVFDFEKPTSRDLTETVRTLAHLARFIIADITEPRSISQELQAIVPDLAVPVQPLLLEGSTGEYSMFQDLRKYDWVLETYRYDSPEGLLASLGEKVIAPAEAKAKELAKR